MTLEEAIRHAEEVSESLKDEGTIEINLKLGSTREQCLECSDEHRQLAEWLKDYKRLKSHESHTTFYKDYAYCEGGGYQVIYGDRFCNKMEKPMSREEFQTWIDTYITGDKA